MNPAIRGLRSQGHSWCCGVCGRKLTRRCDAESCCPTKALEKKVMVMNE